MKRLNLIVRNPKLTWKVDEAAIGEGNFGQVYCGKHKRDNIEIDVAIKTLVRKGIVASCNTLPPSLAQSFVISGHITSRSAAVFLHGGGNHERLPT